MSHHHHRQINETNDPSALETNLKTALNLIQPFIEKRDLALLSLIKPLLSPNAQKTADYIIGMNGAKPQDLQLDLPGLLSQLNLTAGNNPLPELFRNLINSDAGQEAKPNLNPALLTSMLALLDRKNKNEDS